MVVCLFCPNGSMVEQLTCNEQVVGSSPTWGSNGLSNTYLGGAIGRRT